MAHLVKRGRRRVRDTLERRRQVGQGRLVTQKGVDERARVILIRNIQEHVVHVEVRTYVRL